MNWFLEHLLVAVAAVAVFSVIKRLFRRNDREVREALKKEVDKEVEKIARRGSILDPIHEPQPDGMKDLIEHAELLCDAIMKDLPSAPVNRIPNIAFARQNLLIVIKAYKR